MSLADDEGFEAVSLERLHGQHRAAVEDKGRLYRHQNFYSVDDYMVWAKQHPDLDKGKPQE